MTTHTSVLSFDTRLWRTGSQSTCSRDDRTHFTSGLKLTEWHIMCQITQNSPDLFSWSPERLILTCSPHHQVSVERASIHWCNELTEVRICIHDTRPQGLWSQLRICLFVCYNEVWPDMQTVGKFETYHHEVCHEDSLQSKGYQTIQRLWWQSMLKIRLLKTPCCR